MDASGAVDRLLVLNPQGHVPRLIVCPTVEGLTLLDHGFEFCMWCLCRCYYYRAWGSGCYPVCTSLLTGLRTWRSGHRTLGRSPHQWQRGSHLIANPIHFAISAEGMVSNMKFSRPKRMCCLRVGSMCFVVHAPIIGTGSDALGSLVCHLANWLGADQFVSTSVGN